MLAFTESGTPSSTAPHETNPGTKHTSPVYSDLTSQPHNPTKSTHLPTSFSEQSTSHTSTPLLHYTTVKQSTSPISVHSHTTSRHTNQKFPTPVSHPPSQQPTTQQVSNQEPIQAPPSSGHTSSKTFHQTQDNTSKTIKHPNQLGDTQFLEDYLR